MLKKKKYKKSLSPTKVAFLFYFYYLISQFWQEFNQVGNGDPRSMIGNLVKLGQNGHLRPGMYRNKEVFYFNNYYYCISS